jgi:hypothetical protein
MGSSPLPTLQFLASMLRSLMADIMAEKTKDHFLARQLSLFLVLPFSSGSWSNDNVIVQGKSGQTLEHYFTWPLACSWGDFLFCHPFLIVPEIPMMLLGWDLLSQLKAYILLLPGSYFCCPLIQEQIDSTVWTEEMRVE